MASDAATAKARPTPIGYRLMRKPRATPAMLTWAMPSPIIA